MHDDPPSGTATAAAGRLTQDLASVAEARAALLAGLVRLGSESVGLGLALGRILAEDVLAGTDLPGTDNSSMDGYAVAARDVVRATVEAPVTLQIGGESRAGAPPSAHLPGTATIIATGAPLPCGADAVVPVEQTRRAASAVTILAPATAGDFVRRRGEDAPAGTVLARTGDRLRSVDIGVCAAAGRGQVNVARRPRVALISTGDELVAPGTPPLPHQVTDINGAMLSAAVSEAGGIPIVVGVIRDDAQATTRALEEASAAADLIVSSAGVSMGGHDHVRECVAALGSVDLWKVAMRPGKPLVIGRVGTTPFIGLPGNPVSSAVTFLLFARPAILALQGATQLLPAAFPVVLAESFAKPASLEMFVRVRLHTEGDSLVAVSSGGQGSGMMRALGDADGLAILPAGVGNVPAGATVQAIALP